MDEAHLDNALPTTDPTQNFNVAASAPARTRKEIIQLAIEAEERRLALQEGIEGQKPSPFTSSPPKEVEAKGAFTLRNAAKLLRQELIKLQLWMENQGWLYKKTPNGRYFSAPERVSDGHFHTSESLAGMDSTRKWSDQIMLTPKGLAHLGLALKNSGGAA